MGFRFRKSVNLGIFRINLSKTGIGYSVGTKGFRLTKTARNTVRSTLSAPGTGLSYVEEKSLNKKNLSKSSQQATNQQTTEQSDNQDLLNNVYRTEQLENVINTSSFSDGLAVIAKKVKTTIIANKILTYTLLASGIFSFGYFPQIFVPIFLLSLILKLYVRFGKKIKLEYSISPDMKEELVQRFLPIIKLSLSQKAYIVRVQGDVSDTKYSSGVSRVEIPEECEFDSNAPFPFSSKSVIGTVQTKKEKLIFLPDAIFVMKGMKVGAFSYSDIKMNYGPTRTVLTSDVPQDTTLKGMTWKYVNSDGTPDKRFSDNPQYPICLFGRIELFSPLGLNTVLLFSKE